MLCCIVRMYYRPDPARAGRAVGGGGRDQADGTGWARGVLPLAAREMPEAKGAIRYGL